MKTTKLHTRFALLGLLLALVGLFVNGCGSVEGDAKNASQRPWNTPKYWEGGLPSSMNEGR